MEVIRTIDPAVQATALERLGRAVAEVDELFVLLKGGPALPWLHGVLARLLRLRQIIEDLPHGGD